jgi:hypothetical protein
MSYTITIPRAAQVTWNDANDQPVTENVEAGARRIEDACEAYSFVIAYSAATGVTHRAGNSSGRLSAIRAACLNRPTPPTVIGQTKDAPAAAPDPVPAEPGDDTANQPPPNNPPAETMAPEAVDAPRPPPAVETTTPPTIPGVPDGRPIEERAHDPEARPSDAAIAADIETSGNPNDTVERVRRNEPTPGLPHYEFGRNDEPRAQVVNDPVDLFRGAFVVEEIDVHIPGRLRPLQLVRRYRSGGPYFGPWGFTGTTITTPFYGR